MKIKTFNTSNMPIITVAFKKDDDSEIKIDLTLQYIQNVLLFSVDNTVSQSELQQMLLLIRQEVLMDEAVKDPIADNDLVFDVFIKSPKKLYRFGLSNLNSDAEVLVKAETDDIYATRMTGLNAPINNHEKFIISALNEEQKQDPNTIRQIQVLKFKLEENTDSEKHFLDIAEALKKQDEVSLNALCNYPSFIKNWWPCLESESDRDSFFKKLLNANTHCYVVRTNDKENKLVGLLMVASSPDGQLHYLGNFVVDKAYRNRIASIPLLGTVAKKLGGAHESLLTTFLTDNDALINLVKKIGVDINMAKCPIDAAGKQIEQIPIASLTSLLTLSTKQNPVDTSSSIFYNKQEKETNSTNSTSIPTVFSHTAVDKQNSLKSPGCRFTTSGLR